MQIGLDYMQMRTRAQYYGLRWAGISLLAVGGILAAAGIAYYGYLYFLRASLDDYEALRHDATLIEAAAPSGTDGGTGASIVSLPTARISRRSAGRAGGRGSSSYRTASGCRLTAGSMWPTGKTTGCRCSPATATSWINGRISSVPWGYT